MFCCKVPPATLVRSSLVLAMVLLPGASSAAEPTYQDRSLGEWVGQLKSRSSLERRAAIRAIGVLEPPAREAVPALVPLLDDPVEANRKVAAEVLGSYGPQARAAVAPLLKRLHDPDAHVRQAVLHAIDKIRPAAKEAIPALLPLLEGPSPAGRKVIAGILGHYGRDARPVVFACLGHRSSSVRAGAALAIAQMGEREGIPLLLRRLADPDAQVRQAVLRAIRTLEPASEEAVPALLPLLDDPAAANRELAALALGGYGAHARAAATGLLKRLNDPEPGVRQAIVRAIDRIKPPATNVLPALLPLLNDAAEARRAAAADALACLGGDTRRAVMLSLEDANVQVRAGAAAALPRIGIPAQQAVPLLVRRLQDMDAAVRAVAAAALGRFELEEAGQAVPALEKQTRDTDPAAKEAAVAALLRIRSRTVEKYLYSGALEKGERALQADLAAAPRNDQVRFGLGLLQFLRGVEQLGQSLHRYGAKSESTNIPFLRLPVPDNPQPAPITYTDFRRLLDDFGRQLSVAEKTLAGISDDRVKLSVRLADIRLDLDGDGKATDQLIPTLQKVLGQQELAFLRGNPGFLVSFDRGDVAWLRAYCHLLTAILDFYLAFDSEWLFDLGAEQLFANPRIRPQEARQAPKEIVLPEPARLGHFRKHLIAVARLNHETWKYIRAETDNDHEWLPNARQQGVLGLPVRDDMVDAWLAMMTELQALLEGKRTLPRGLAEKDGKGLSLKALLDDPPKRVELRLRFPDDLPEKYFSDANDVDPGVLFRVIRILSDPSRAANPLSYALYLN